MVTRSLPLERLLSGFVPGLSWPGPRPLRVLLDTTNRCNIRCVMCHFAYEEVRKEPLQSWSLEFLAVVAREVFPRACQAQLSLGTEPLVWKHFPALLAACKQAGVPHIEMYTNGLLLTPELARTIVATPMARVELSLEGATAAGFEAVRVGGSFARFLAGVELLAEAKRRAGSLLPILQFNITLLRRNAHEVLDILRLARRSGVTDIDFRHVIQHDGLGMEEDSFLRDKPGFNRLMAESRALIEQLGLHVVMMPKPFALDPTQVDAGRVSVSVAEDLAAYPPPTPRPQPLPVPSAPPPAGAEGHDVPECWAPWRQVLIRADGSVVPCPFWYTGDVMGNLHRQSFMEIWEGAPFRALRRGLLTRDHHQNCALCPLRGIGKVDDDGAHRSHNLEKGQFRPRDADLGATLAGPPA